MTETAQVDVIRGGDETIITCSGVLDFTNSSELQSALKEASATADKLTVDLRAVDFMDTAIVQYLATAAVTLMAKNQRLKVIVREGTHPLEVLHITGFGRILDIEIESLD